MQISKTKVEHGYLLFTILALSIGDSLTIIANNGTFSYSFSFGTYLIALYSYVSVFIFLRVKILYSSKSIPRKILVIYTIWLAYLIISLFRGVYLAKDYWESKFLFLNSVLFTLISRSV